MKIIKKINALLLGIVFIAGIVFSGVSMWSTWENNGSDKLLLGGKAHTTQKKELQQQEAQQQIEADAKIVLSQTNEEDYLLEEATSTEVEDAETKLEQQSFTFVAIGDAESYGEQTGFHVELIDVMKHAKGKRPDFALFTGDIITASSDKGSGNYWRIENLKTKIDAYFNNYYFAFGKHDVECGDYCVDAWNEIFFGMDSSDVEQRKLYHSFDYLNTHFVLLSTDYPEKYSVDKAQLAWLKQDLENNTKPNLIVVQHVPPVTFFKESAKKCHDMSCSGDVSNRLLSMYRKNKVDCVISGHENAFDHKIVDGIDFVLSGNSGNEPKYKDVIKGDIYSYFVVNGESIQVQAVNTENEIIRDIKIK